METRLYMLDSSVCIAVLRNAPNLEKLPSSEQCCLSQITVAELWTGVEKGAFHLRNASRLTDFLAPIPLLDFDEPAARAYGEIRAALEKKGRSIGPLDLLIAAHARSIGATLLTGNFDEFRRVPALKVLRWA